MDGRERGVAAEIVIGRTTTTAGSSHFPEIKAIRIICQRNNFCLSFSQQKMKELGRTKKKKQKRIIISLPPTTCLVQSI